MSADPKLTSVKVEISHEANDGYSATFESSGRWRPASAVVAGITELARLAELYGLGAEAELAVSQARDRVKTWRATQ